MLSQTVTFGHAQWTDYNEHDPGTTSIMPDWFKNNAKWWNEGLISDADMLNALESLMIQDVIPLDKFVKSSSGIEHQAGIQPGGTFVIPNYQKNVFQYWSDGAVSDGEIVNSIGHLMSEGIINSEKIEKEITERKEKLGTLGNDGFSQAESITIGVSQIDSDLLSLVFETSKENELSMKYLQKIKSAEYEKIKNAYDLAVSDYSKNKDQDTMHAMNSFGNAEKIAKEESLKALDIYNKAVELAQNAKDNAVKSGLHPSDLEKKVSDKQSEIESMQNIETESDIREAYKDAQKTVKKSNDGLEKTLQLLLMDNIKNLGLPGDPNWRWETSFATNEIEHIINADGSYTFMSKFGGFRISDLQLPILFLDTDDHPNDDVDNHLWIIPHSSPISIPEKFDQSVMLILDTDYKPGDDIVDSATTDNDLIGSWDYDFTVVGITLPDGKKLNIAQQVPSGILDNLFSPEIIEGLKMINEGLTSPKSLIPVSENDAEICILCGDELDSIHTPHEPSSENSIDCTECSNTNPGEQCIICGDIKEMPLGDPLSDYELEYYEETEKVSPEPTYGPESNTGFTDSGEVYVGAPFVAYDTGIWFMIIGNERHEFDTRDAALAAIDELVEKFKNSHSSQSTSESTTDTNSDMTIPVFMFQNDAFPAYQFLVNPADANCASQHLSPYNQDVVYAINFNDVPGMEWDLYPKRGCGFGILDSENIRYIENYEITDKQASDYTKRFGISPDRPLRTR